MMKKVSLSQLLSRSPRHGGGRCGSANGEVVVLGSAAASSASSCSPFGASSAASSGSPAPSDAERAPKKKSKGGGLLQTLKKKISTKLELLQGSSATSSSSSASTAASAPRKSKSVEGLSNSFGGDSFSQSISEESSSDGLNASSGGGGHKGKHNKRQAIRPINTPVTRQNSSSHVLTDGDGGVGEGQGYGAVSLYSKPKSHISDATGQKRAPTSKMNGQDKVPTVKVDGLGLEEGLYASAEGARQSLGDKGVDSSAISETASPQPNRIGNSDLWDLRDMNLDASRRSLAEELFRLAKYGWYWGPITRAEAEEKLHDQPDGAFLVRDSSDDKYLLSLSFRSFNRTLHTRIEHSNGWFSFYPHPEHEGHTSLVGLIDHSMSHSESGVFCYSRARGPSSPSFPVRLTKPVSRFTQVRSLQYLCRFVIRQYTRVDHIQALPLPTRIKGYLEEGHY